MLIVKRPGITAIKIFLLQKSQGLANEQNKDEKFLNELEHQFF